MTTCLINKIDSNNTGLRYAVERCLKELSVPAAAVPAVATVTFTANPANLDTIIVGLTTYTMKTAITVANDILIGANTTATAANFAAGVIAGAGGGTVYGTGTLANARANAVAAVNVVTLTALLPGFDGNSIVMTASGVSVDTPFVGGLDATTDPIWYPLEPNSYGDFGQKISTVARNPINPSRQKQKGVVVDLEANAAIVTDFTQVDHMRLLQGFMFAQVREQATTIPLNRPQYPITAVASGDSSYAVQASVAAQFLLGTIVLCEGFTTVGNNGVKVLNAPTAGKVISSTAVTTETPPATASIKAVGQQFVTSDISITMNGNFPRLTAAVADMSALGLVEGEWIYVGADVLVNRFAVNTGFARIGTIHPDYLEFDKVSWAAPAVESGAGKTIRVYFGSVIRNEEDPALIVQQSVQFERTLGQDADGTMAEYVIGAVANELSIDTKQADKITLDMMFVGCDHATVAGNESLKVGTRPSLVAGAAAFNSSSDVKRISLGSAGSSVATPLPLVVYCTDLAIKVSNSVTGLKAIGTLGNFDLTKGMFDVSGSLTGYFQDVEAIRAVRNNADITLDMILVKDNAGIAFDIPLVALGNGLPKIEQDQPVTLPLDTMAAQSDFGHTLLYVNFAYLPTVAAA